MPKKREREREKIYIHGFLHCHFRATATILKYLNQLRSKFHLMRRSLICIFKVLIRISITRGERESSVEINISTVTTWRRSQRHYYIPRLKIGMMSQRRFLIGRRAANGRSMWKACVKSSRGFRPAEGERQFPALLLCGKRICSFHLEFFMMKSYGVNWICRIWTLLKISWLKSPVV